MQDALSRVAERALVRLAGVLQEVEMPVFGAAEEVGDAVGVEIDNRGADVVPFDVSLGDRAGMAEDPVAVALVDLLEQVGVGRVEQQVELAVAGPIDDAQLAAPAAAGLCAR